MRHNLAVFKPDFDEAKARWAAFWAGELIDRPVSIIRAPKPSLQGLEGPVYLEGFDGDIEGPTAKVVPWCASIYWGGDAVPTYVPSFGPDQFAAFLGAELNWSADSPSTNWAEPCVNDWKAVLPLALHQDSPIFERMATFMERLVSELSGRVVVAHLDLHSNFDALSALRSPAKLCEDMLDHPDLIDEAMDSVRTLFGPVYEAFYRKGAMDITGSSGWITAYCEGRYNVIQCDAICLISPAMSRRWVIPALEEEAAYLDHCIYHLDGPGALVHLDDLLSIADIDCIQWVPGDGQPHQVEWLDLLKRIQEAGKSIILHASASQIRSIHKELQPNRVIYDCWCHTEDEARELEEWLVSNT